MTGTEPESRRCWRCSSPLYLQRIGTTEGLVTGEHCIICGHWRELPEAPRHRRPAPQRLDALVQCAVVGCTNMVLAATTRTCMCHVCNRLMKDWERSAKKKPAPLVKVAGRWVYNPARKKKEPAR